MTDFWIVGILLYLSDRENDYFTCCLDPKDFWELELLELETLDEEAFWIILTLLDEFYNEQKQLSKASAKTLDVIVPGLLFSDLLVSLPNGLVGYWVSISEILRIGMKQFFVGMCVSMWVFCNINIWQIWLKCCTFVLYTKLQAEFSFENVLNFCSEIFRGFHKRSFWYASFWAYAELVI